MSNDSSTSEYRCPGEDYAIPRAVHLARLAGYYPACRECPRRGDTLGLSARQVRRLEEVHAHPPMQAGFTSADLSDMAINDFQPQMARAVAAEFAARVVNGSRSSSPTIVFAADGRMNTASIVAAMAEGIRWTGCEVVDLAPASSPCAAAAVEHLAADGGIYLGNPSGRQHRLGIKFWQRSRTGTQQTLHSIGTRAMPDTLTNRPVRAFGPVRRFDAAEPYLDDFRAAYHALRPLRCVVRCECSPVFAYLDELMQNVACRVIPAETVGQLGSQVTSASAHFGMEITDNGERGLVFDERGQKVEPARLATAFGPNRPVEAGANDALRTLTLLLVLLSRDDLPLSQVLDRDAVTR